MMDAYTALPTPCLHADAFDNCHAGMTSKEGPCPGWCARHKKRPQARSGKLPPPAGLDDDPTPKEK